MEDDGNEEGEVNNAAVQQILTERQQELKLKSEVKICCLMFKKIKCLLLFSLYSSSYLCVCTFSITFAKSKSLNERCSESRKQYALGKEIKKGRKAYKDKLERKFQSG